MRKGFDGLIAPVMVSGESIYIVPLSHRSCDAGQNTRLAAGYRWSSFTAFRVSRRAKEGTN